MRSPVLILALICFLTCGKLRAQATSANPAEGNWFVLAELVLGMSVLSGLGESDEFNRVYLAAEVGPMFRRGDHAWGGSALAGAGPCYLDDCSWRVGLRARYRRWLSSEATLDLGLGPLSADGRPGVGVLAAYSPQEWIGVTLQGEVVSPENSADTYRDMPIRSELLMGVRFGGKGAAVSAAALVLLGLLFAASWQY